MVEISASGGAQVSLRSSLLQRVKGIGRDRANRLVTTLGDQLNTVLSDPANIEQISAVIAPERPAMGRRLAASLIAHWNERLQPEYATLAWLDREGIVEAPNLARRLVTILGSKTRETLEANPYVLAKTLRWSKMDGIGQRLLRKRMADDLARKAPARTLGALDNAIGEWMSGGHTAIPKDKLTDLLANRLGRDRVLIDLAVALGEQHGRLIDTGSIWRFAGCAFLEHEVMTRLEAMSTEPCGVDTDAALIDKALAVATAALPRPLSDEQATAVRHALSSPFSVIAGGAGTGKTATMHGLVLAWEALGGRVHLCALAGKAALRLSQATRRLAKTLHRSLLELNQREKAVEEGKIPQKDWTELTDRTLVIVDEASMVDLGQWARLLKAMPRGCRLVMVGDTAQLPPIGFGLVFHVLAQRPTTTRLTRIFRQDATSGIPIAADAIRSRRRPTLGSFLGAVDGVSLLACSVASLDNETVAAVVGLGGFGDDGLALHVVAATNKRVEAINCRFHEIRRRDRPEVQGFLGSAFSVGDPVVHLENDYRRGLFNGVLGTVVAVDPVRRAVEVTFDGERHSFEQAELAGINLAYALTCHKLQGSQAPRVVIALEPTLLLEPSWLYTAVTRAERQAVLVGPSELLDAALRKPFAWSERYVGLA